MTVVGWGPHFPTCSTTPADEVLTLILDPLGRLSAEATPYCSTEAEDLVLAVAWRIEDDTGYQELEMHCLTDKPALIEVLDYMRILAMEQCP